MNVLNKYLLLAILGFGIALTGAGILLKRSWTANGIQKAQIGVLNQTILRAQEQRALDQATLALAARKIASTARETASAQASLASASRQNRSWADQPVPKEVQDALK